MEKKVVVTPLSLLPEWRKEHVECNLSEVACSRDELRTMCGCMRRYPTLKSKGRTYDNLASWYMPRNPEDVDCFVGRYRIWEMLPAKVTEVVNRKNEKR